MTDDRDLQSAAYRAASVVASTYDGYVEQDDLYQEGLIWLLKHPQRVEHARFEDTGRINVPQLVAEIADPLGRAAKRTKMHKLGMDPRDLAKYNRRQVEAALPVVWDSTYRPTVPENEGGRSKVDAALRGNWEATSMDVKRAVAAVCTKTEERLLFVTYVLEAKTKEAAWRTGEPRDGILQRVHRIVTQLVDYLNDDVTMPDEQHEGPGARQVLSNAHAQVLTSANYGGA